ncbi:proline--tRNA ligase [Candidatus Dependentiae bacterium]|nr:proline--tRNA ligase [Candidatus Dependentiae bacterium]
MHKVKREQMSKLPDINKNFAEWYQEVIHQAELVDHSPVRGTMVVRPYGTAIWENIKKRVDHRIKETGHHNAMFPLFIPESFLKKEADHVKGFAPELAIVTHAGGKKLEDPLVVRPTSETIIHYMFARWIKSWRDLPLKINQWANVVRWEMRPRAFLRTTEFFWQEGHTAHETYEEAKKEANLMLQEYIDFAHDYLAVPVISGTKSEAERFPGADETLTFEAIMPDGKALQMGTSHLISQNFAHAFDMSFQNKEEKLEYPHLTSWGVTTRLVGALIMVHGDQKGLVLPPKIAPIQVVIIPILKKGADNEKVLQAAEKIAQDLKVRSVRVFVDKDDHKTPGAKFYHWELRGVPIRIEIGPRDLENKQVMLAIRIEKGKEEVLFNSLVDHTVSALDNIQKELFKRAQEKVKTLWHKEEKLASFGKKMEKNGGLYQTGWCLAPACEQELKKYKASTRCLLDEKTFDVCFHCDQPSKTDVLVAKSY